MTRTFFSLFFACAGASALACSSSDSVSTEKTDAQYQADTVAQMHDSLVSNIDELLDASKALQSSAPNDAAGWTDANVTTMKTAWVRARSAYEQIEGALASIFPDLDHSIDARIEDFVKVNGIDTYMFDDQNVTGLHAAERIIYAKDTPDFIKSRESDLHYTPAAWPATDAEAADFKNKLCAKIVADAQTFHDQWTPQKTDIASAFTGLVALMNEQKEKVNNASLLEEESRYSQRTMADLRDNLTGTRKVYALFQPWLFSKSSSDPAKDGKTADAKILAGFQQLDSIYATVKTDQGALSPAIPQPPASWSAENPSAADLATPFGQLYKGVLTAVDKVDPNSVVSQMNDEAAILGFQPFVP
ncbi:MAG TPA: EfeM/EfeO family lipoprotein [Polyangiaceae bacterium]|nr:EfeM/EfeO family lipoprotein [Polyangiaceae bacterium]